MSDQDKKKQLVDFLDKKAFEPVLHASADRYDGKDRQTLQDVQRRTREERDRYRNNYKSAGEVKVNFQRDLDSEPAKKVHRELKSLGLPTLNDIRGEFEQLCDKLQV